MGLWSSACEQHHQDDSQNMASTCQHCLLAGRCGGSNTQSAILNEHQRGLWVVEGRHCCLLPVQICPQQDGLIDLPTLLFLAKINIIQCWNAWQPSRSATLAYHEPRAVQTSQSEFLFRSSISSCCAFSMRLHLCSPSTCVFACGLVNIDGWTASISYLVPADQSMICNRCRSLEDLPFRFRFCLTLFLLCLSASQQAGPSLLGAARMPVMING